MENDQIKMLSEGAKRARVRPGFMANALAEYASTEGLSDVGLAEWLGCRPVDLQRIGLCIVPKSSEPDFRTLVQKIAEMCTANVSRLIQLLRMVEAHAAIRNSEKIPERPMLKMAARQAGKRRASQGDHS
jgi:hypothetical protein